MPRICKTCLLPENFPAAAFSREGICRPCADYQKGKSRRLGTADQAADLETALKKSRGQSEYDCIVLVSGGKDSALLAHKIVNEYRLRTLAVTVDTGLLSPVGAANVKSIIESLGVAHLLFKPPFRLYKKLYTHFLRHPTEEVIVHSLCRVCASMTEGTALTVAMEKGIPLILVGYAPNQPPDFYYEVPPAHVRKKMGAGLLLPGALHRRRPQLFLEPGKIWECGSSQDSLPLARLGI